MRSIPQPLAGPRLAVLTLLLGGFTAFGPLSMDLYLPAFPALAADLDAGQAGVQLTLTADVIGLVFGQLVLGPLSDTRGRRWLLIGSTLVCGAASALCAVAPSVAWLTLWRSFRAQPAAAVWSWPVQWPPTSPAGWRRHGCSRCS
ncbi:MAG TPA: MFS transporter [Dermatophilaceae bacterium]|nr:MFS transporter [Dermatophilaceae bacterium]